MVPAQQHNSSKDRLQSRRSKTGKEWEYQLCRELNEQPGAWACRWQNSWQGQPFDLTAVVGGIPFAIECKSLAKGALRLSALRPREIENLERFEQAGGISVIAVRRMDPPAQVFIPWVAIRHRALAGDRGSERLERHPKTLREIPERRQRPAL